MSGRVWSRPRTRVYEANYNAGESYYKSALDGLDRKYGRSPVPTEPSVTNASHSALSSSLERDSAARRAHLDDEEIDGPRIRSKAGNLLEEFDSIFDRRSKNGIAKERTPSRTIRAFEDEADQEFAESMKRVKASRAARAAAEDLEEIENNLSSRKKETRSKLNFSSKLIDSVGVMEDASSTRKKVLSMVASPTDSEELTRWTSVGTASNRRQILDDENEESSNQVAAAARARKSRARLEDLEAEMQALEERGAAREKRIRDLRSLLSENEATSKETLHSTVRVKSSIQSDKKQVTF